MKLLANIAELLRPKKITIVTNILEKLKLAISENKIKADVMIGGSYAKGTNLNEDFDVDIFIKFSKEYKTNDLADFVEKILTYSSIKFTRIHGSRDYFQFTKRTINFEVIPVFNIKKPEESLNITDVSPLHVSYVKKHILKNSKLADEIRLTKQFMKSAGVYGAESYIQGFSGHVVDLLIVYYGSFKNLLVQSQSWSVKQIIDIEKKSKSPLKKLNKAKIEGPLIIIDPIQSERNAAAAVSSKKFRLFKKTAKSFLKQPSKQYFKITKLNFNKFKKKYSSSAKIVLIPLTTSKDIAGSKILKIINFMKRKLIKENFKINSLKWEFYSKGIILVSAHLKDREMIIEGPPISLKKNYDKFKSKHNVVFEEKNRIYAKEKVNFTNLKGFFKKFIQEKYVLKRIKGVEKIEYS